VIGSQRGAIFTDQLAEVTSSRRHREGVPRKGIPFMIGSQRRVIILVGQLAEVSGKYNFCRRHLDWYLYVFGSLYTYVRV